MIDQMHKSFTQPSSRRALILFTSHPVKEAQRKQLADRPDQVQRLYQGFLSQILRTVHLARGQACFDVIIASDSADLVNIEKVYSRFEQNHSFTFVEHRGKTFAEKFEHILKQTARMGYQSTLMIGNDCLDLTPEMLAETFHHLDSCDLVIGPSIDGGFYLIGMNGFREELFREIPWCTAGVLEQLHRNIRRMGISLFTLPALLDIDHRRDLLSWLKSNRDSVGAILRKIILAILAQNRAVAFPENPFLEHTHLARRCWQLPPPVLAG